MKRFATFPLDDILPFIEPDKRRRLQLATPEGQQTVKVGTDRMAWFKRGSHRKCALCERRGTIFAMELRNAVDIYPHLNLYAVDPDGTETMMSFDRKGQRTLCNTCFSGVNSRRAHGDHKA